LSRKPQPRGAAQMQCGHQLQGLRNLCRKDLIAGHNLIGVAYRRFVKVCGVVPLTLREAAYAQGARVHQL
jgi:hypothetical protein